ncbi:restriction endonuclease subunit S [Terrilactibacillus sp. BCM23-1]|uniref:Restriction endonuclease subunit S n=1 Tax=Terrilactibacillus tamarindi TaxID=2599694 RepID=A0A6N8CQW0_9BACI|nr:restriction endonuclease subunit S [Terrilactibacillus tamarindi]MTT32048.1 restriction endonuclease subunit S [Terrilactibacillus tamarindi]
MEFKCIGDIASFVNGFAFKPEQWETVGLPIIRIQNLTSSTSEFNYYNGKIDDKYIVNKGDILIAWSASLGVHEWNEDKALLNQHIFKVVFNKVEVNKSYFKYMVSHALTMATKYLHGSTMKHLTKKYFDNIQIPFPSLRIQEHIGKVLDNVNNLVNKRRSQIAALDELTQSVFLEMFGNPKSQNTKFAKKSLGDFGEVITGNTPSRKVKEYYGDHIEWIKSDNINTPYHFLTTAEEYLSEKGMEKGRIAPKNSILITCIAGSKSCIGNAAIADRKVAFNQQINAIIPRGNPFFLYTQFLVGKELVQSASTNGMKGLVSKGSFQKIEFISPPNELQDEFGNKFLVIQNQKQQLLTSLQKMEELYNSLLQKSFKGELFQD